MFIPSLFGKGNKFVLAIRVIRNWIRPYLVVKDGRFYGRGSGGKYPLDVLELRTAFLLGENTEARVRRFQANRITRIVAGAPAAALEPTTLAARSNRRQRRRARE
jgi:hypothetical protein